MRKKFLKDFNEGQNRGFSSDFISHFGVRFSSFFPADKRMLDHVNEKSFPAWCQKMKEIYQFVFDEMMGNPDKEELFHKDVGWFCASNDVKNIVRMSSIKEFKEKRNYFDLDLNDDSPAIKCYHLLPQSDDVRNMAREFFAIFNSDKFSLKRNCFTFFWTLSASSTFLRGQASITEWSVNALAEVIGDYAFTYSQDWSSNAAMNIDQRALTALELEHFLKLVEENVKMSELQS